MRKFFTLFFAIIALSSHAKDSTLVSRHKLGLNFGAMQSNYPEKYIYDATYFQVQYNYTFARVGHFDFEVIVSPQYNTTYYSTDYTRTAFERSYELGFTAGINVRFNMWKERLFVSAMGIIGPMYTPHMPARQGTPLNFSDNLAVAIGAKFWKRYILDLRMGYRHMSNAGFNPPNYGLNSHWVTIGVYYEF